MEPLSILLTVQVDQQWCQGLEELQFDRLVIDVCPRAPTGRDASPDDAAV